MSSTKSNRRLFAAIREWADHNYPGWLSARVVIRLERGRKPANLPVPNHRAPAPPGQPTRPLDRDVLEAASSEWLTKRELAEKAGYRPGSHFLAGLTRLCRAGLLEREGYRYRKPPAAR
jgi:hypothetical protein